MTDEQRKLVEDNMALVRFVIKKHFPFLSTDEDIFQIGCVGLCRAAIFFDKSKGFAFSTYASQSIYGTIAHGYGKPAKKNAKYQFINTYDDEGDCLLDNIKSCRRTDDEAVAMVDFKTAISKGKDVYKKTVLYAVNGYTQDEIAEKLKISQAHVCRQLKKFKEMIA